MDPVRQNYGFIAPSPAATEPCILPSFLRKSYLYIPGCHFLKEASEGQGPTRFRRCKKSPKGVLSGSLRLRRQAGFQQVRRFHLPLAALVDVVIEQGF